MKLVVRLLLHDSDGAALRTAGPRCKSRARLRALLGEVEAEAAEKPYEVHLARRAEKEAVTGKPIRGRRPANRGLCGSLQTCRGGST